VCTLDLDLHDILSLSRVDGPATSKEVVCLVEDGFTGTAVVATVVVEQVENCTTSESPRPEWTAAYN